MTATVPISERRRAALAGALTVGVALGAGELLAALLPSASSPLVAVGDLVIEQAPPRASDLAIALFGQANKAALEAGTAVLLLGIGVAVGVLATHHLPLALAGIAAVGIVGANAGALEPASDPAQNVAVVAVSAGLAALTLWWLLGALGLRASEQAAGAAPPDPGRRRFIGTVGGTVAVAAAAGALGRWGLFLPSRHAAGANLSLPEPARPVSPPGPEHSFNIRGLERIIVPNDRFYRIDTAIVVPRVDPAEWRMRITGMVDREIELDLDDLWEMPLVEEYVTLACVSNEIGGDLVGNAKWTGVPLRELLEEAGVQEGATQVVGRSVDDWTAGFPTELVFDGREPLVAVGMNSEPLPPKHGFPARLIVPGLYGYVSATKWLSEIELTTWDGYDAYWVPRGWAKEAPIKLQSRIDVPRGREVSAGEIVVAGVAWDPLDGIERVEIRVDDGPWQETEITTPLSDKSWVQWRRAVELPAGRYVLAVRATNGSGTVQTADYSPTRPDGATGHHMVRVNVS